jgi:hypothetical protein
MTNNDVQIEIIEEIGHVLAAAGVPWWLFGGWGMDAHIGRITREHGDIELWVAIDDADTVRTALVAHGFEAIATQPPEEAQEFERDGLRFSTAFFARTGDGYELKGRWSDWNFPPGSLGDIVGMIGELKVPVMSVAGMLAMKTQYPTLRNGGPLRPKDIADINVLRGLL